MKRTNFDTYLEQQLADPEFAAGFARAGREWDLALQISRRREKAGLTQRDLARRVGTTQQQISRLEQPGYRGSIRTIERVAAALGATISIRLTDGEKRDASRKDATRALATDSGKPRKGA